MFAVPGWSVSAENLKSEVASAPANHNTSSAAAAAGEPKKSKKRKRPSAAAAAENVTSSNVADLWERVIEQKKTPDANLSKSTKEKQQQQGGKKTKNKDKKRQKLDTVAPGQEDAEIEGQDAVKGGAAAEKGLTPFPKKTQEEKEKEKPPTKDKKGKKDKKSTNPPPDKATSTSTPAAVAAAAVPAPRPAPKLTPLQASMREKLISARFRHLNETLYTRPSAEALSLFAESPDMFTEYHEGFRRQVEVWPENPVEGYLAEIRQRGRAKDTNNRNKKSRQQDDDDTTTNKNNNSALIPLPRNRATGTCTIADLGCGDARLAAELAADKRKLRLEVLSFDLHSPHPLVTRADIANLPLANGTVDVALFCLALMGTNWVDFVEEAYRVLRWKGELWVAEIKSRFGHVGGGNNKGGKKNKVVEHSVGHRRNPGAAGSSSSKKAGGNKAGDDTTLLVEVDGVDDTRQQTDVSAFVKVLNQRGFVLVGQDQGPAAAAIDLSNKMFVKMKFLKAAPALKGKCVRPADGDEKKASRLGGRLPTMPKKSRFLDAEDEADGDEAAVLKPCVYKIR